MSYRTLVRDARGLGIMVRCCPDIRAATLAGTVARRVRAARHHGRHFPHASGAARDFEHEVVPFNL